MAVGWLLLVAVPVLIMPFDHTISLWIHNLDLPGDIEKDMDAIQQFGTLPADLTEKNLRLFSGEVMPRIRHLGVTAAEPAPVGE